MSSKTSKSAAEAETVATLDDPMPEAQAAPQAPVAAPAATPSHYGFTGEKVRVIIAEGEGDAGKEAVFVGLNDYAAQIPRNQEVQIPREVFDACIAGAKIRVRTRVKDGIEERDVPRFAYAMLGMVPAPAQAAA